MRHIIDMIYPRKGSLSLLPRVILYHHYINSHLRMDFRLRLPLLIFSARPWTVKWPTRPPAKRANNSLRFPPAARSSPPPPPESAGNASVRNNNSLRYWTDTRTARALPSTVKVRGEVEKFDESVTSELRVCICGHSCIGCRWLMSSFLGYRLSKKKTLAHSHLVAIVKGESRWLFPSPFASNVILLPKAKNQPHPRTLGSCSATM